MHIKYDARELRQDQLISPDLQPAEKEVAEPIQYVLMNPIKPDYEINLAKTNQQPNILIATLPTEEEFAQQQIGAGSRKISGRDAQKIVAMHLDETPLDETHKASIDINDANIPEPAQPATRLQTPQLVEAESIGSGPWGFFGLIGQSVRKNPFSLASSRPASDCAEFSNANFKQPGNRNGSGVSTRIVEPRAPHVSIANDPALIELRDAVRILKQIDVDSEIIREIEEQLEHIAENGSLDEGLCEACLYRILDQTEKLPASQFDEDSRLIESIRGRVIDQINGWIDQLNGLLPEEQEPQRKLDEMDYQRLNTALQSFMRGRFF